ncbi:MAG: hypothetical protein GTN38_00325 [Candidatus Aenigmarchaeota archaeon]|nr:hypothetical protein [Candidatus Aenigmarchaeota archaeon]NIP39949.1 hypothetical protein [Candidatus Aenigmarchaeota archaeon]NIQ17668.1 hypothetical protein [Candidatus Aenigmarchaeota archaeon]NIS72856.1 hypothetical protein [Candidatus Aenigmarchaeota archaeon]
MTKPAQLTLLVFCLVLLSGCVGQQTTSGNGIVIESFVSNPSEMYSGEPFNLQLMIRNTGSVDAGNVRFELSNIGATYENRGLEISCKTECSEVIERFLAPDPRAGTTGESKTCIWKCSAPEDIPRNSKITFNPSLRVYYDYESNIVKSVTIISESELRSIQAQGRSLPSETTSLTAGPVKLSIQMRSPVRYIEDTNKVEFPISISIENAGGGVACYPTCDDSVNWNKVFLETDPESGMNLKDCEVGMYDEVDLWEGRSRTVVCDGEISLFSEGDKWTGINILKKTLKIRATYEYFTDAATSLTVTGF